MNIKIILAAILILSITIGYYEIQTSNLKTEVAETKAELTTAKANVALLITESDAKDELLAKQKANHALVVQGFAEIEKRNRTYAKEVKSLNKSLLELAEQEGENHDWLTQKIPYDIAIAINNSLRTENSHNSRIPTPDSIEVSRGS